MAASGFFWVGVIQMKCNYDAGVIDMFWTKVEIFCTVSFYIDTLLHLGNEDAVTGVRTPAAAIMLPADRTETTFFAAEYSDVDVSTVLIDLLSLVGSDGSDCNLSITSQKGSGQAAESSS